MAKCFVTNVLVLGRQTVTASGNNELYVNGVLVGSGIYAPINALSETGSYLYNLVTGTSGQIGLDYATKVQLTNSGIIIEGQINSLSGWAASATNLGLTGQILYHLITGESGTLQNQINNLPTSLQLYQTGSNLYNMLTGSSGQANLNFATLINLAQTGSNLYVLLTGLSGQSNINYATVTNLVSTGSTLYNDILGLSGNLIASGAILSAVKVTGSSIINNVNFTGLGGTLIFSSGGFVFISGGNSSIASAVTSLNGLINTVNITGTGGLTVTLQGQNIVISGDPSISGALTASGVAIENQINALSGFVTGQSGALQNQINNVFVGQNLVYTTGNQSITGTKYFTTLLQANNFQLQGDNSIAAFDANFSNRLGFIKTFGSPPRMAYSSGTPFVLIRQNVSGPLQLSAISGGSGINVLVGDDFGNLTAGVAFYVSGSSPILWNQSGFFYSNSNPSGFITGLAGTGNLATISQLNSLSGYGEGIYVHRTGNELITGSKLFLTFVDTDRDNGGFRFVGASGTAIRSSIVSNANNDLVFNPTTMGRSVAISNSTAGTTFGRFYVTGGGVQPAADGIVVQGYSSFGTKTPLAFLHSTGFIRSDAGFLSGSINIADLLYPSSNPSGYTTGASIDPNSIVYTTGNQNIGNIKFFRTGFFTGGITISGNQSNINLGPYGLQEIRYTHLSSQFPSDLVPLLTLTRNVPSGGGLLPGGGGSLDFRALDQQNWSETPPITARIGTVNTAGSNGNARPSLVFYAGNNGVVTEKMRLDYLGNLGVTGTITTLSTMFVNGTGTAGTGALVINSPNNGYEGTFLYLQSKGEPNKYSLQVKSDIIQAGNIGFSWLLTQPSFSGQAIRIANNARVGIGDIFNPNERLVVSGFTAAESNISVYGVYKSGTIDITNLYYTRNNPSGYLISGFANDLFVHRFGDESITGQKTFVDKTIIGNGTTGSFGVGSTTSLNYAGIEVRNGNFLKHTTFGFDNIWDNVIKYGAAGDPYSANSGRFHSIDGTITAGSSVANKVRISIYTGNSTSGGQLAVATFDGIGNTTFAGNATLTGIIFPGGAKITGNAGGVYVNTMTVGSNGNVGIGIANPNEKLTVSGGNIKIDSPITSSSPALNVITHKTGDLIIEVARLSRLDFPRPTALANRVAMLSFFDGLNNTFIGGVGGYRANANSDYLGGTALYYSAGQGGAPNFPLTGAGELMEGARINEHGYFGIGTKGPQQSVHATGFIRSDVGFLSGSTNLVDILYPRNNPSGYITNIVPSVTTTTNYSVNSGNEIIYCNNTSPITITMPAASTVSGQEFIVKLINTGLVYLTGALGNLFDGQPSYTLSVPYASQRFHAQQNAFYFV